MNKQDLRESMLLLRKAMSEYDVADKSKAIYQKVILQDKVIKAKSICVYISFDNEPDTLALIDYFIRSGKTVSAPVIVKGTGLVPKVISDIESMEVSSFGIKEPVYGFSIDKHDIDVAIIPGLVFDMKKNRIGFGKAYYDRFLSGMDIYKIAVAYDYQITNEIHAINTDIPMDIIITESRIIV